MLPALAIAALQAVILSPAETALTQAHAGWLACLTADTGRTPGAPPASEAQLEHAFAACRAQEAEVRARAARLFGEGEADGALALYRQDAREALSPVAGADPLGDAARAWGACMANALPRTVEARGGRSDREIAEAAFASCLAEERATRAVLAARNDPAEADETIAVLRAQVLAALPQMGVPPARP